MNNSIAVFVKLEPGATFPDYKSAEAAGLDLSAFEDAALRPLERRLIRTGVSIEIPRGYEGQIRPRSGLALKQGLTCLNSPGTIDSDYRGELKVLLINLSDEQQMIHRGDRIAQLVIAPVSRATVVKVRDLSTSERGTNGFGSTGVGVVP